MNYCIGNELYGRCACQHMEAGRTALFVCQPVTAKALKLHSSFLLSSRMKLLNGAVGQEFWPLGEQRNSCETGEARCLDGWDATGDKMTGSFSPRLGY